MKRAAAGILVVIAGGAIAGLWVAPNVRGDSEQASEPTLGYQGTSTSGSTTDARLACTTLRQPVNFRAYSLGPTFAGHPVRAVVRRCDEPYPSAFMREHFPDYVRGNYMSYIYGDCQATDETGCAPPFEIQTWPACERSLGDYTYGDGPYPHEDLGQMRGVPAVSFDGGQRLELYAGSSTIVIFGDDPSAVRGAVAAVRPEATDRPPGPPLTAEERQAAGLSGPDADLAEPAAEAMSGDLACAQ